MNKKRKEFEQWGDMTARLFPELYYTDIENKTPKFEDQRVIARTVTFQVTDACNLACKYCYQINKGRRRMSIETAKKFVDLLLDADESNKYINPSISPFIIIEFIGGEPLLEIDLIDEIMTYFTEQAFVKRHPWATRYIVSLCSNGVLYFEPNVQRFFRKHKNHLSLNITIDGNKELHDSCRVFPDGSPSYDMAVAAAKDWMDNKHGYMGSKITIAPGNITYLYDALVHMIDLGYLEINANCVYEEGWNIEYARELYNQMKHFSDYLLDNNLDEVYCSLYEEHFFHPKEEGDDENWCWGTGTPILTDHGYIPIENIKVGDLVYTHDGTLKPVTNVMCHHAENTVTILLDGIKPMVCTDNHKIFVKAGNSTERVMVKNITSQDLIMVHNDHTHDMSDFIFDNDNIWAGNLKLSAAEPQTVYNITVAENHSYVAGGIVSSNCGGTGVMLSCDPDGYLYPCIRYMESSLGDDQEPMRIGHVDFGIETNDKEIQIVKCLNCITRRTQSTDECYYCPIAEGCSWCSAYNYQIFGTADKRATYICEMHKARALANVYYWNKRYKKNNEDKKYHMWCPKEWALPIIGEKEYEYLLNISESKEYSTSKPEEYTFSNYEKSTDFIK